MKLTKMKFKINNFEIQIKYENLKKIKINIKYKSNKKLVKYKIKKFEINTKWRIWTIYNIN